MAWKKKNWQLWQCHCRNRWHKFLAIVAMTLPKMGKKKGYEICERVKKKLSRPQYFYNIFTINHTWLVIISLKNMWQTNCGNCIAKIGRKKKLWDLNCGNAIAEIGRKKIFLFWQLWQWHYRKWKKKCYEICERVKKKVVMSTIFLQHFHNKSHMISYY